MSDLIRREDVTDILADLYWADERLLNFKTEIDAVYDKILTLPSADAVNVVRCKDCRKTVIRPDGAIYCEVFDREEMPQYGYCNWGERKGGEDE